MKMVTKVAYANMKYHKSKNILTGIAIFLTTLLLFLVPAVGFDSVELQFAVTNKLYPTWQALYRNVDTDTVNRLRAHHDMETYGLRSDVGKIANEEAEISMYYMDETGMELYRIELTEGHVPKEKSEIMVSKGMLDSLGIHAGLGDTVRFPVQKYVGNQLDYIQETEFQICGFLPDSEAALENQTYMALISREYMEEIIPGEEIRYRFLFRVSADERTEIDKLKDQIKGIAGKFGISEAEIGFNDDYLYANYTDPAQLPIICLIMLVIIVAGVITIYSIYYISMTQRIQEFGRIKAMGATRKQVRQIVLREGFCVALIALPLGLAVSTVLLKPLLLYFVNMAGKSAFRQGYEEILRNGECNLYPWWLYLLTCVVALVTVYLSLLHPMQKAAGISEVEAMRYQEKQSGSRERKGYQDLTVGRLAKTNLYGDRKKSVLTILTMSITGMFVMVVATALSCASPSESADSDLYGQYELSLDTESGNQEHPEKEWDRVIANNPLTAELKAQIERLDGVERVETFTNVMVESDLQYQGEIAANQVLGLPESCFEELKKGIVEGKASWSDLLEGDKVIVNKALLYWCPEVKVGDQIQIRIEEEGQMVSRDLEVIAIGDYRFGLTGFCDLIFSKEAADSLLRQDCTGSFQVLAEKKYDAKLEKELQELAASSGLVAMQTWKEKYDFWKNSMNITQIVCIAFLCILSMICIMNLINTMIHSVHIRKKELGMMQAIGMTDAQMAKMLRMEGLFYTSGTLLLTIGAGSILGYPVFLWMKAQHLYSVTHYHYPTEAAVIVVVVMVAVQLLLITALARSVKKESLIDRIRFSE